MKKKHSETTGLTVPVMPVIDDYDAPGVIMFNKEGLRLTDNMRMAIPAWDDDSDDLCHPDGTVLEDVYLEARSIYSREDAKNSGKRIPIFTSWTLTISPAKCLSKMTGILTSQPNSSVCITGYTVSGRYAEIIPKIL